MGMWRLGVHYDVLKRDPNTGEQIVVATTRPCVMCGEPLETGIVLPAGGDAQVHAACARTEAYQKLVKAGASG